ncbi:Hypothetical protein EAG7_04974 [Klebsiella aerogenes]|nr:Hypothetical protein EAG7_04974 [Klebsiella aerogenes]
MSCPQRPFHLGFKLLAQRWRGEQAILRQRMANPGHQRPIYRLPAEFLEVGLSLLLILTELEPDRMGDYQT